MAATNYKKSTWGRGRGSFRGGRAARNTQAKMPDAPMGEVLLTLDTDHLEQAENFLEGAAKISGCTFITSFNWISAPNRQPTVLIPGEPPRWTPPSKPTKLAEDSGEYLRDQNAARFPKHPMEPTALALLEAESSLRFQPDFVVCGSTFGNLLKFVQSDARYFRFLVERVGHTVFFVRREKSPTEKIEGVFGYGHTFPEAYTSWSVDSKGSESHQRLVRYKFGGFDVLMRFEGDGYLPEGSGGTGSKPKVSKIKTNGSGDVGDLIPGLNAATVSSNTTPASGSLHILRGGQVVCQSQIFDLKTRSHTKKDIDTLGQELPRLWARQIPNFILAHHRNGIFEDIKILSIKNRISEWENENSHELSMLAVLLEKIATFVESRPEGKFEICCDGGNRLEFRKQLSDAGDVLSSATKTRWITALDSISKVSEDVAVDKDGGLDIEWKSDEDDDYTACTVSCGYCGRCTY